MRATESCPGLRISIHALRVEGDTTPKGGAYGSYISIHALRVEGDGRNIPDLEHPRVFYPRPPGGGRPIDVSVTNPLSRFLSTPSGWRATCLGWEDAAHTLEFLSTPSGWRATYLFDVSEEITKFLSTPSGWRATIKAHGHCARSSAFLSTPSGWRATEAFILFFAAFQFLSTPSGWRATTLCFQRA